MEDLYCEDNGRPSVDPVVLFKIVLIQHIYGLPSLRRTLEEVSMNLAYRWFIGYPLNEAVPHFSTVSYNFKHRFNHATVEYVFRWVLEIRGRGRRSWSTKRFCVDGTHIQASANPKKQAGKAVPKQAKRYAKELFEEVNEDREEHEKPFRTALKASGNGGVYHHRKRHPRGKRKKRNVLLMKSHGPLRQARFLCLEVSIVPPRQCS